MTGKRRDPKRHADDYEFAQAAQARLVHCVVGLLLVRGGRLKGRLSTVALTVIMCMVPWGTSCAMNQSPARYLRYQYAYRTPG